ncbi:4-phosphoerythronate dehydrogenase [Marinomonas sp. THO17]|uniref:4-phosphoerythronate dehydrogenase n=1 Tax=Marinomonas sp. THO17 TaxID=3149048 RepID=UPI00336C04F9
MKIVADENMPNVKRLFSHLGEVTLVSGRDLSAQQVKDADALLVRSVTKVNENLLTGSKVKFVGSATIGVDHIDEAYLRAQNIAFSSAPGCNAEAVADYVFSALGHLYLNKGIKWLSAKVAVIGYGNVGRTVYKRFAALGCQVCVYDPLKLADDPMLSREANFVELADVLTCDVICLHSPMTQSGPYPTLNMLSENELAQIKAGSSIISAGRGGVINEDALLSRYKELSGDLNLVLDVWHDEPNISQQLVNITDIATPHIAGYSRQGREKGTWMVYQALCKCFGLDAQFSMEDAVTPGNLQSIQLNTHLCKEEILARSMHAIYDVARDDARLRFQYRINTKESTFDWLRKNYVERDEFNTCQVHHDSEQAMLKAVGFNQK